MDEIYIPVLEEKPPPGKYPYFILRDKEGIYQFLTKEGDFYWCHNYRFDNEDDARVKALVAALEGVNIDEAVEKASVAVAAPAAAAAPAEGGAAPAEEKKEEKKDEKKDEAAAAAGLGALFG